MNQQAQESEYSRMVPESVLEEIANQQLIDLQSTDLQTNVAINQIDNFLNVHLKQGFTGIKKVLYTNDRVVMFDAAHKQLGCTKLVGLPRLAFILNYMQKTVSEQEFKSDKDFIMYLQYYRVLFIELKNTRLRFIEVMREHNYDSQNPSAPLTSPLYPDPLKKEVQKPATDKVKKRPFEIKPLPDSFKFIDDIKITSPQSNQNFQPQINLKKSQTVSELIFETPETQTEQTTEHKQTISNTLNKRKLQNYEDLNQQQQVEEHEWEEFLSQKDKNHINDSQRFSCCKHFYKSSISRVKQVTEKVKMSYYEDDLEEEYPFDQSWKCCIF